MSYVDKLGMCGLPKHNYIVVSEKPIYKDGKVIITFEKDNIITNCLYGFDLEYGLGFYIEKIEGETVTFKIGEGHKEDYIKKSLDEVKIGDKMRFFSILSLGGEYHNGRPYRYAEL